ncbi:Cndp1 [Scenedesmus sp. PABB004]|nr:Cndp1 [Scenedesmus sp. PABB004]
MCRLMAYIGPPRLIADVVLWPDRSIIKQSYDARERLQDPSLPNHLGFGNLNGDGFGIGWYTPDELREGDPTPCMYKSITPAWNNENLARLSCKIISPLVFAHVRAAYPGMPVSEQNCHPFQWGRYIWMHNGVVGGFSAIKRRLLEQLSDAAYDSIQSFHSDSAVSFAVFLSHLPNLTHQQSPDVLVTAMQAAISTICGVQDQLGVTDISLLNFVVSDGSTLIATRFVRPEGEAAATLYYAEGASFDRQGAEPGAAAHRHDSGCPAAVAAAAAAAAVASVLREASYSISYRERGASVAFVASEPITGSTTDWVSVPKNTVLVVTREKGGFISSLQSSLSAGAAPDARLQEVSTCLASIAQGVHTKSRAWVARRGPQQQPQQQPQPPGAASPFGLYSAVADAGLGGDMPGLADSLLGLARSISLGGAEPETVTMEEEHLLTGHTRAVLALVLDEPRGRMYSSSTDATVRAWDLADMACLAVIRGHPKPVTHLQLLGGRLLFTGAGGAVRVWDTRSFACLAKIRTSLYAGAIRSMLVTDDGSIYVGHQDTTVKKYLPLCPDGSTCGPDGASPRCSAGGAPLSPLSRRSSAAGAGAAGGSGPLSPLSPRCSAAGVGVGPAAARSARAAGGLGGPIRSPDAQTDIAVSHVGPVNDLVACGAYICSAGGDTTVRVWRASDLSLVRVLRGHRGSVLSLLAVGTMLLSGSRDNTIRVWDLDLDFMCRRTLIGHKDDVVHLDALGLSKSSGQAAAPGGGGAAGSAPAPPGAASLGRAGSGLPGGLTASELHAAAAAARAPSPALFGPAAAGAASTVLVASASADGTVRVWGSNWACLRILTICAPCADWRTASAAAAAAPAPPGRASPAPPGRASPAPPGRMSPAPPGRSSPLPAAIVGFAGGPVGALEQQHAGNGTAADASFGVPLHSMDRSLAVSTSLSGWVAPQEQAAHGCGHAHHQQSQQQQQQQSQQQQQQQQAQQQRRARRAHGHGRGRHAAPATAALVVAISSAHVVGGYSDSSIRLWHMDDVYLADLTEQLVSGQICADVLAWSDQLRLPAASFSPFQALSFSASASQLTGGDGACGALGAAVRGGSGALLASPPMSPTCLASQLAGQLLAAQGLLPSGHLLSEGSGHLLGVEVLQAERQRKRGAWCARLRDAGCCGGSGGGAPPQGAAVAGGGALLCPACGSQDQQLVRALREFVAIRTVSANKVHAARARAPRRRRPPRCLPAAQALRARSAPADARRALTRPPSPRRHQVLRDECLRGAKYLSRLLEALGAEVRMAQPFEGKNPVVLGRLGNNPAHPTVAFYGHYDVQPAEEPDWRTNPFELCAVDGYLCGRGTSDNKGPVLAFIYAVKEMLDCWRVAGASAPLNFAFMFEGEEENGSIGFQESLRANLDWFGDASLVLISNTVWVGENVPCLTYGMRGMVTASLVVSGPSRDLHSGNDGGVFSEPMADLVQLLGSLQGAGGRVAVPGFHNGVRPGLMELAWTGLAQSDEFRMDSYREAIGVPQLTGPDTYELLNKRWCSPTLSIVDVRTTTATSGGLGSAAAAAPAQAAPASAPGSPDRGGGHSSRTPPHSPALAAHAPPAHHGGCVHAGHDDGRLWPTALPAHLSHLAVSHTDKHGGGDDRVIPKVAVGKLSLRFVPAQAHTALIECLQQHIDRKFAQLWSANHVELQVHSVGDWWEADPQSQLFQMAEAAVRREWGVPPLAVREGGTMPVASLIEKLLGAPALMIPMGQSSDNCHLANERLRRINLIKGKNVVRHLLEEVAAAAGGGGGGGGSSGGGGGAPGGSGTPRPATPGVD